jgi:hypothetical protein
MIRDADKNHDTWREIRELAKLIPHIPLPIEGKEIPHQKGEESVWEGGVEEEDGGGGGEEDAEKSGGTSCGGEGDGLRETASGEDDGDGKSIVLSLS